MLGRSRGGQNENFQQIASGGFDGIRGVMRFTRVKGLFIKPGGGYLNEAQILRAASGVP